VQPQQLRARRSWVGRRLNNVVVDRGCHIPEDILIGEDPEFDAQRFYPQQAASSLVSADMLAALG
jgi:glucose-1-phosphate adenylyltransferase